MPAIKGTTFSAKEAIRVIPPQIIKPTNMANGMPT